MVESDVNFYKDVVEHVPVLSMAGPEVIYDGSKVMTLQPDGIKFFNSLIANVLSRDLFPIMDISNINCVIQAIKQFTWPGNIIDSALVFIKSYKEPDVSIALEMKKLMQKHFNGKYNETIANHLLGFINWIQNVIILTLVENNTVIKVDTSFILNALHEQHLKKRLDHDVSFIFYTMGI